MRRRDFVILLGGGTIALQGPLHAQQRLPRIGVLLIGGQAAAKNLKLASELARLGYVAGNNISYDIRAAEGNVDRLPVLARELVADKPNVLIGASSFAAEALAAATADIPIVMTIMVDPIATGFSTSMSRPSRNVTGFTSSSPSLAAKRLQLLHELIPGLRRVAYLTAPSGSMLTFFEQHVRAAARTMGVTIHTITVSSVANVSEGFAVADREHVQAVLVEVNPTIVRLGVHIINECLVRDLARYVDRILKGAKVSELPFEEPTEIKLAINLRTARSLKIAIPQTLLARADEVIE